MDSENMLRDSFDYLWTLIKKATEMNVIGVKEWELSKLHNNNLYKFSFLSEEENYGQRRDSNTFSTLSIWTNDSREIRILSDYHNPASDDLYDTESVDIEAMVMLNNGTRLIIDKHYGYTRFNEFNKIENEDINSFRIKIDDTWITPDFLYGAYRKDKNGIKEKDVLLSNDGKTIIKYKNKFVPSKEVMESYDIDDVTRNYLAGITVPLTLEKLKEIQNKIRTIKAYGTSFKKLLSCYPTITKDAKNVLEFQSKYYKIFKESFFIEEELSFIIETINEIVDSCYKDLDGKTNIKRK